MKLIYFYVYVYVGIDILVIIWYIFVWIVKFLDLCFVLMIWNENWDWKYCLDVRYFKNFFLFVKYFIKKMVLIFNDIIDIVFFFIILLKGKFKYECLVYGG